MSICSSRLALLMQNAYNANSPTDAVSAFNEWQSCNCYHPQKVRVYDAHTQTMRIIRVPCGRCYHCKETRINEWVTRMYAHAESYCHVYFITLTYRSFYSIGSVERLMLRKLSSAVWRRDDSNATHRLGWNPCLLVKSHYQNFIKRLRKNTGISNLSYVICGEYGKKFGRPHFHAILFSPSPISRNDIVKAWSVALWRSVDGVFSARTNQRNNGQSYNFPIGRVDYHDLVTNGSFNTTAKVRIDDNLMSASHCFAYVCKYVCKRERANLSRVVAARNSLFKKNTYVQLYSSQVLLSESVAYCRQHGLLSSLSDFDIIQSLKKHSYVQDDFTISGDIFPDYLQLIERHSFGSVSADIPFYPTSFTEFRDKFAPFVEFSRGTAIGSLYAKTHVHEFADGVYKSPSLQDTGFVVPSYFRRKAQDYLFRFREMRKKISGVSYVYGGLVDRLRHFHSVLQDGSSLSTTIPLWQTNCDYQSLLQNPTYVYRDAFTGERVLTLCGRAMFFKYDRKTRSFVRTHQLPVADYIRMQCSQLRDELKRHSELVARVRNDERLRDLSFGLLSELGLDYSILRDNFELQQQDYLQRRQFDYDATHASVE